MPYMQHTGIVAGVSHQCVRVLRCYEVANHAEWACGCGTCWEGRPAAETGAGGSQVLSSCCFMLSAIAIGQLLVVVESCAVVQPHLAVLSCAAHQVDNALCEQPCGQVWRWACFPPHLLSEVRQLPLQHAAGVRSPSHWHSMESLVIWHSQPLPLDAWMSCVKAPRRVGKPMRRP
jgi:hypothetical protein